MGRSYFDRGSIALSLSVVGALVFGALLLAGRFAGNTLLFGLLTSLAFGSTAIVTIPALGNSSPLIYAIFVLLLTASTVMRPYFLRDLSLVFREHLSALIACLIAFYAIVSAITMPRLFAGEVNTFIPVDGMILEMPLAPSGGNLTQTAYLLVGVAVFFSVRVLLSDLRALKTLRVALFSYVIANASLGLLDIAGKFAGLGDCLLPIRTAEFSLLSEDAVAGFWRIVGGHAEASAFAIHSLACVSFTFMYWRCLGSTLAFVLTIMLTVLLAFSTSSTAYAGLTALAILAFASIAARDLICGIKSQDIILFLMLSTVIFVLAGFYLHDEHIYDPFSKLIREMIFEKADSMSGQERSYWNRVSFESVFETYGLGVGMGSSRSSSWLVSVLAQLGLIGALLFGALWAAILNGAGHIRVSGEREIYALISSARAMAIGWLIGISIAGSGAEPGLLVFLLLGIILGCKHHLRAKSCGRPRSPAPAPS
jgi:hypothetical protein